MRSSFARLAACIAAAAVSMGLFAVAAERAHAPEATITYAVPEMPSFAHLRVPRPTLAVQRAVGRPCPVAFLGRPHRPHRPQHR